MIDLGQNFNMVSGVVAGATAAVSTLAIMAVDEMPKKARQILAALVLASAGFAGVTLGVGVGRSSTPKCPVILPPPHVDQGLYIAPPRPESTPGLV